MDKYLKVLTVISCIFGLWLAIDIVAIVGRFIITVSKPVAGKISYLYCKLFSKRRKHSDVLQGERTMFNKKLNCWLVSALQIIVCIATVVFICSIIICFVLGIQMFRLGCDNSSYIILFVAIGLLAFAVGLVGIYIIDNKKEEKDER